jgi:hypothetical protein
VIKPGVFKHYKGNLYRVLFVAPWWSVLREPLQPDQFLYVAPNEYGVGLLTSSTSNSFLMAKWSGNDGVVRLEEPVVIYVSLSDHGRVSARTVREFEEKGCLGTMDLPRFERIGD